MGIPRLESPLAMRVRSRRESGRSSHFANSGRQCWTRWGCCLYPVLQSALDPTAPWGSRNYWKSDFVPDLSNQAIDLIVEQASRMRSPLAQIHVHQLGGAVARTAPGATAFHSRDAAFVYNLIGLWMAPED